MKSVKAKSERDKHVVEAVVRRFGPLSRAKIHELTHIRPSATSQIVRELLKEGRLVEAGVDEGHLGRKGVLLRLNEQYQHLVGVEFDDESVTAGVTDLHPRITHQCTEPTLLSDGVEGLVRQLVSTTRRALSEAGMAASSIVGIGIADPGLVDSRRGITRTSSTIGFWRDVPLKAIFEREFGVPALVETRTRAKAVAERKECSDDRGDSMVYVDYGTGIGAGICVDGRMLLGYGSAGGEFGHTRVVEEGPACNCGSFGCLEAIAGMRAVEARVRRAIGDGGFTDVLEMAGGDVTRITGWMVFEAAGRGDKISSNIVAEVGRHLGLGIANLVNLFNPAVVVLDSSLRAAGNGLLDQITAIVKRQALRESTEHLQIRHARAVHKVGVLGVAQMVIDKHFEIPAFKLPPFLIERKESSPVVGANG
ncbi:MAG: ROK family protein [Bryobacteraceae bacterium]